MPVIIRMPIPIPDRRLRSTSSPPKYIYLNLVLRNVVPLGAGSLPLTCTVFHAAPAIIWAGHNTTSTFWFFISVPRFRNGGVRRWRTRRFGHNKIFTILLNVIFRLAPFVLLVVRQMQAGTAWDRKVQRHYIESEATFMLTGKKDDLSFPILAQSTRLLSTSQ